MKNQLPDLHPELRPFANKIPRFSFAPRNLWLMRWLTRLQPPQRTSRDIQIENCMIPARGRPGRIRLRTYRPFGLPRGSPAMVWLHGGGYIIGRPEMDDLACVQYALRAGIYVISVDYRRAPEHPFPTPLEDGYAALAWLAEQSGPLGVDVHRIAIGGRSAGGGLAAALAQLAADRREIQPVFQLLVYPMLDDRTTTRGDIENPNRLAWNMDSNRFGWESYLGQKCGLVNAPAYAVPSRRLDLCGLPPAWLGVGSLDLFHEEDTVYAQRLAACGIACQLVVVPGVFHGFDIIAPQTGLAREFQASQIHALKRFLFSQME